MEAFGRGLVLEPYFATVVLGGGVLRHGASDAQKSELIPKIAAGELRLAFAHSERQARYDLAMALDAANDRDGAITELLDLIRRDRAWNEDAARKQLVTLFEAMGPTDPRTIEARRKLSGILFS